MVSFWRARTTMNPIKPMATSSLVTSGAFRLTRNPMYLSLLLYLLAWVAYLSNCWLCFCRCSCSTSTSSKSSPRSARCPRSLVHSTPHTRRGFAGGCEA
ncbi:methyltransferase [Variovorax sp. LjRoot290]